MQPPHFIGVLLRILIVLGLVALNAFFVAAEYALVKVRETQLDELVAKGNRRAKVARKIIANLNAFLSATQLGVTIASLGLGWAGEPVFNALLNPVFLALDVHSAALRHSLSFAVGFSALTFLHICAGELAPKWSAIQNPLPISLRVAQPLRWFYLASYPFNWLLNQSAQGLLRLAGIELSGPAKRSHSPEELRLLIATAQKDAEVTALGRDIVLNALDLRRRCAREVMRPRQEIIPLDTKSAMATCLDIAEKTRYSRFPLCEDGDIDKAVGVVHIKDLYAMRLKARAGADLLPVVRKIVYVPETARSREASPTAPGPQASPRPGGRRVPVAPSEWSRWRTFSRNSSGRSRMSSTRKSRCWYGPVRRPGRPPAACPCANSRKWSANPSRKRTSPRSAAG